MSSCDRCGQPHDTVYDATVCELDHVRAEARRYRDALLALDGTYIVGTHDKPGIGHEAMWRIVRDALDHQEPGGSNG